MVDFLCCLYFKLCFLSLSLKKSKIGIVLKCLKKLKVKMPPRQKIVRKLPVEKPEWEGKGCLIVRVRDLSLKEDADVWAEMAKVTLQAHKSDWICRQEVEVELTDVSTQADLIPGNAVRH